MNPIDPITWHDLSLHPTFSSGRFDPSWYDGDVVEDLAKMRTLAIRVRDMDPNHICELFVLDDCTMFIEVRFHGVKVGSVYPSTKNDADPGFFIDLEGDHPEIRCDTIAEALDLILRPSQPQKP